MTAKSDTIAFIQPYVPSYRAPLFDQLKSELERRGFGMEVWHAKPTGIAAARANSVEGVWSRPIPQYRVSIGTRNLTYRPVLRRARAVAGVVAGLASTNLETYRLAGEDDIRLMLWGHGRNFTAGNSALDMRLEGWLCARARHVFAYTDAGREHLEARGVPAERLSTVRNSTDVVGLRAARERVDAGRATQVRANLGLEGKRVGLFVGALDESKRLPFLFEASDAIVRNVRNFHLVVAGAGRLEGFVRQEVSKRSHTSFIGRLDGGGLAEFSRVAEVLVIPGRVGLVAVDSLALGVPLATTDWPFHAPEADYLDSTNSVRSADDVDAFASAVAEYLKNGDLAASIREKAWSDGGAFSVQESARVFADGIVGGLVRARRW